MCGEWLLFSELGVSCPRLKRYTYRVPRPACGVGQALSAIGRRLSALIRSVVQAFRWNVGIDDQQRTQRRPRLQPKRRFFAICGELLHRLCATHVRLVALVATENAVRVATTGFTCFVDGGVGSDSLPCLSSSVAPPRHPHRLEAVGAGDGGTAH